MPKYKIAWLPGDGVGVDVLEAAKIVLDALRLDAEYIHGDIGWECWRHEGDAFPARTVELLKNVDAALFGAITSKPVKSAAAELDPKLQNKGLTYRSPIVRMRQMFDLYICLRPCKGYPGNALNFKDKIDLVVFRENTEDLYAGVEFNPVPAELAQTLEKLAKPFAPFARLAPDQYAVSCKINTRGGSERIARAAFEFARKFKRRKVTVVHKANVVRATDGMFLEAARAVAKDFPEIQMDEANVDALTMWLLKNPHNYDVLVAPNLYGDIISDLCAGLVGGLGIVPGANMGEKHAVFEAVHGSAPDIAGKGIANPTALMLSGVMMLIHLKEMEAANRLQSAIESVYASQTAVTRDLGGNATTQQFTDAVVAAMK